MTLQSTCDAWMSDLAVVSGLTTALQHKYASWSAEQLHAEAGERHLAVWPNGDAIELIQGFVTQPADLSTQTFTIAIWEDAASEATRLYDNDTANIAWLALYEAVRARLYVQASVAGAAALAGAGTFTRFVTGSMGLKGTVRWMEFTFRVQVNLVYS